jgi:hypothetical protein
VSRILCWNGVNVTPCDTGETGGGDALDIEGANEPNTDGLTGCATSGSDTPATGELFRSASDKLPPLP